LAFTHLHIHSQYSILDGAILIPELIPHLKKNGMDACAITDHGWMAGIIEFYKECKKNDIKPLIGCLLKGQEIVTPNGVKNVEDIKPGDLVLTHKGRFMPVTKIFERDYEGDLCTIRLSQKARSIQLTEEHPILVVKRQKANRWHSEQFSDPEWIKPKDIKTGRRNSHKGIAEWNSYACLPKLESYPQLDRLYVKQFLEKHDFIVNENEVIRPKKYNKYDSEKKWDFNTSLLLDENFARFLGLYVAEGSLNHNSNSRITGQIIFSFNINEIEYSSFIEKVLLEKFNIKSNIYIRPEKSIREVVACSVPLAYLLGELCGIGAKEKIVPSFIFNASEEVKKFFILGVLQGDGKQTTGTLKVSSRNLAWGMRTLMASEGHWGSITEGTGSLNGKEHQYYMLNLKLNRHFSHSISTNKLILKPITNISTKKIKTKVFNFEVFGDNSYVSDIILHNCEAYITDDPDDSEERTRDNKHMVLIAKDNTGYQGLLSLVSNAARHNFYYKPRIYKENLRELSGHVIATTSCLAGVLSKHCIRDLDIYERAAKCHDPQGHVARELDFYLDTFGSDLYLELQVWKDDDKRQTTYNEFLLDLGRQRGLPFVITADAHYLTKEDSELHELLMAMQTKMSLETYRESSEFQYGPEFYVKTPAEMLAGAQSIGCEEAYYNTEKIAEQCNVEIELGTYYPPVFNVEEADDYSKFLEWKNELEL